MRKILIISNSPLHRDPRVLVQIQALKNDYSIHALGLTDPGIKGIAFTKIGSNGLPGKAISWLLRKLRNILISFKQYELASHFSWVEWKARIFANRIQSDLILCNDIDMLPTAAEIKQSHNIPLYLDAHEYTPRQWDGDPEFKKMEGYWDYIIERDKNNIDYMTTVCESIAEKYRNNYNLPVREVVMNLPAGSINLQPSEVAKDHIRLVHHGGLNRNRQLENMIHLFDYLDSRFSLDFYLMDDRSGYLQELQVLAKKHPQISFRNPVSTVEISKEINQYDIGLFPLSPLSTNYRYALPNKFFEFIQARLAIAIWPSVEMKNILTKYEIGVVTDNFNIKELADKLNHLTHDEIFKMKERSDKIASTFQSRASEQQIKEGVNYCFNRVKSDS
ncbi:MAG: hypothetical protein QM627_06535 [Luteolibacter sp.]